MTSLIEPLEIIPLSTITYHRKSTSKTDEIFEDNDQSVGQLSGIYEQSYLTHSNVRSGDFIVLCLSEERSPLRTALNRYLISTDVILRFFSTKDQLWNWLNSNSSAKIASLLIQAKINIPEIVSRSHSFKNVRSIIIRCQTNKLVIVQRIARSYVKIDGVFNDNTRLFIKLFIDLALFSEQLGDQQREDENNEFEAQRNYDRSLKLCTLGRTF